MIDLIKDLHTVEDDIFLNLSGRGGCGVAALAIFKSAKDRGLKPKLWVVGPHRNFDPRNFYHVVVEIDGHFYDAEHVYPKNNFHVYDKFGKRISSARRLSYPWNRLYVQPYSLRALHKLLREKVFVKILIKNLELKKPKVVFSKKSNLHIIV